MFKLPPHPWRTHLYITSAQTRNTPTDGGTNQGTLNSNILTRVHAWGQTSPTAGWWCPRPPQSWVDCTLQRLVPQGTFQVSHWIHWSLQTPCSSWSLASKRVEDQHQGQRQQLLSLTLLPTCLYFSPSERTLTLLNKRWMAHNQPQEDNGNISSYFLSGSNLSLKQAMIAWNKLYTKNSILVIYFIMW